MQGGNDDPGAEPNPVGTRGHCCQHGERLWKVAVVEAVVFGHPEGVDAEVLSLFAHLEREPVEPRWFHVPLRGVAQIEVEPDLHRSVSGSGTDDSRADIVAEQVAVHELTGTA